MYCSEPILITDTVAYCPAVFVSLLLFTTVVPDADMVTCPAPFWTSRQLNPSPSPVPIVTVIALPLSNVTTLPLSPATRVYVVPVWLLSAASKPDMAPVFKLVFVLVPVRLPLTLVAEEDAVLIVTPPAVEVSAIAAAPVP